MEIAALIYSAGVIAYAILLCWHILPRRSLFTPRTYRIYLGSTVVMAVAGVLGFVAVSAHRASILAAFIVPVLIYPVRELWLRQDGRDEVTRARIKFFGTNRPRRM
ncbi:MAG: hypothetical protein P4M09_22280 [Devosia sp.]|nr:hypothetical protein [Devosia sp.]